MGMPEKTAKQILGDKYPKIVSRPGPVASRPNGNDMNKTEAMYSRRLERQLLSGEILDWKYEALTFRLAHRCGYTPDFMVISQTEIQIHEVKGGFVREDAWIKWKMAAEQHPEFRFYICIYSGGRWKIQEYRH